MLATVAVLDTKPPDEAAQQQAITRADAPERNVAQRLHGHDDDHQPPDGERVERVLGTEALVRHQRQHDERRSREQEAVVHLLLRERVADEAMQPLPVRQHQRDDHPETGRERRVLLRQSAQHQSHHQRHHGRHAWVVAAPAGVGGDGGEPHEARSDRDECGAADQIRKAAQQRHECEGPYARGGAPETASLASFPLHAEHQPDPESDREREDLLLGRCDRDRHGQARARRSSSRRPMSSSPATAMPAPTKAVATISTVGRASSKNSRANGTTRTTSVGEQQGGAHRSDQPAAPARQPLERDDQVEPDEHEHAGRDGARLEQRQVEGVERELVARHDADPRGGARPGRRSATAAQEVARLPRPRARRERQQEGGDADREARGQAEVARQQRVGGGRRADREDQERREGALAHVELRHALEVAQDLPALGDHAGHRGEVAAHEHEVGHALGHLRAAALRDRQPRRLERRARR